MTNINFNNLDIFIENNRYKRSIEIWVIEKGIQKDINIHFNGNELITTDLEHCNVAPEGVKPFLSLPNKLAEDIFKAVTEYNSINGIKTKDQTLIEGKLIATENHLEDMRNISNKLIDNITYKKP